VIAGLRRLAVYSPAVLAHLIAGRPIDRDRAMHATSTNLQRFIIHDLSDLPVRVTSPPRQTSASKSEDHPILDHPEEENVRREDARSYDRPSSLVPLAGPRDLIPTRGVERGIVQYQRKRVYGRGPYPPPRTLTLVPTSRYHCYQHWIGPHFVRAYANALAGARQQHSRATIVPRSSSALVPIPAASPPLSGRTGRRSQKLVKRARGENRMVLAICQEGIFGAVSL
jgi:hypothetical protein